MVMHVTVDGDGAGDAEDVVDVVDGEDAVSSRSSVDDAQALRRDDDAQVLRGVGVVLTVEMLIPLLLVCMLMLVGVLHVLFLFVVLQHTCRAYVHAYA